MELGFVIVTHGGVGEELLRVATHIMGRRLGNVRTVQVPFMADRAADFAASATPFEERRQWLKNQVRLAVAEADSGSGVIILTDIIGGTAFNVSHRLLAPGQGLVIAGVNLPMLLKLPSVRTLPLTEAAAELVSRSRRAIEQRVPDGAG